MENHEEDGDVVVVFSGGASLKVYNNKNDLTLHAILKDLEETYDIPIELQVLYDKGRCLNSSHRLDELLKKSNSNILKIDLAVKKHHSQESKKQFHKLIPHFLNPFSVIFDFPETVVCSNLSLTTFATPFDIKREIEKQYRLPISSQTLLHNGRELRNLSDLRELYFNIKNETLVNDLTICLRVQAENCTISSKFVAHATEHNLSSILVNTLTSQIRINLAKEDVWTVLHVKQYLQKTKRIQIEAQDLRDKGTSLLDSESIPNLARSSMEKHLTLNLFVRQLPVEYKIIHVQATTFSELFREQMILIESTEDIAKLKEKIFNATRLQPCSIKIYDGDVLCADDKMMFEFTRETSINLERVFRVLILEEDGVVQECNHIVKSYTETVDDMKKLLEQSKRYAQRKKYLKLIVKKGSGVDANDRLLNIEENVELKFHVKSEKFFGRRKISP